MMGELMYLHSISSHILSHLIIGKAKTKEGKEKTKEKRRVKSIEWEKKITAHMPKRTSSARVPLMMGESAVCKGTSHVWRTGSVFPRRDMYRSSS